MDIAIIDYGLSNLHSVENACQKFNLSYVITNSETDIKAAKILILPGVGAFGEAMLRLRKNKTDYYIRKFVDTGKPLIGICLGFQLLFDRSEEFGDYKGLGLIKGTVKKLPFILDSNRFVLPHLGWNKIFKQNDNWNHSLLRGVNDGDFMYFVHSYYVEPFCKDIVLSSTTYGNNNFCSSIMSENITGFQFHPEKSGQLGLSIFENLKKLI